MTLDDTNGITVAVTLHTAGELARFQRFIADLLYSRTGVLPTGIDAVRQLSKQKGAVTAGDPLPGETPDESAPSSPWPQETRAGAKPVVTRAEAEQALREFATKHGIDRARDLLRSYNVSYLKDLPNGKLGLFVAELAK
jgi:hypothetical protein